MDLRITTYRDLKDKTPFMMLMEMAFWWPHVPGEFQKRADRDIRLKDGPIGFCGLLDGELVSFVGVMDTPTRALNGDVVTVGGIWGVTTNPAHLRRGFSRILMDRAHDYFIRRGYPFSFLCTSYKIVAYDFYRKIGYGEVDVANRRPSADRLLEDGGETLAFPGNNSLNGERIYGLYDEFGRDRTGYVVRQKDFIDFWKANHRIDPGRSFDREEGYALLSDMHGVVRIVEMVARDGDTYSNFLDYIESRARHAVIDHRINDPALLDVYRSRGYRIQIRHFGVLMARKLSDIAVDDVYGDRFHMGMLDRF